MKAKKRTRKASFSYTKRRRPSDLPGRRSQKIHKIIFQKSIDIFKKMSYNIDTKEREVTKMERKIYFDMDGTIADLYGVENWLEMLINEDVTPYRVARPLIRMQSLARVLNRLQREGYEIGIVSWLSKNGSEAYGEAVAEAKREWLAKHLASVHFDHIDIIAYGTPKQNGRNGILFDDEEPNRNNWNGIAYDVNNIIETLRAL